jgi:putative peptidoglycan lipid II flippase
MPSQAASLGRNSAIMAAGTLLSRLTGFARVIAVLAVLGVSGVDDAYNYANAIPNIVYDLLLGGILSASLVPVFVEQLRNNDRDEGDRAISAILTTVAAALAVITVLLVLAAPLIIRFYLSLKGHSVTATDERAVGTSLLHLFAPQVFFLGAIVVSTALLNARRQFATAAFSPVVNNLIAIVAIGATDLVAHSTDVSVFRGDHTAIAVLGIGTTLGYVVQLLVQVPAMIRSGVRIRPVWDVRHPAVRQVVALSGWLLGVVVANQVSLNVILVFAGKHTGDATAYQNAYQFFQLPYAIFTVSVASALTPDLAEKWNSRDRLGFAKRMIGGLRVTLAFLLPAAVGYALLAQSLISLAVQHGQVHAAGARLLGATLIGFVVGLPGFSAFVLLMRGYQAMQDTRTMFKMYALENFLSLVATYPAYHAWGVQGLALAWSIPYSIVAVVAAAGLRRRVGSLGGSLTVRALWRIAVVSAVMGAVLAVLRSVLPAGGGTLGLLGRLIVEVGAGAGVYFLGARALGIEEIQPVLRLGRRLARR